MNKISDKAEKILDRVFYASGLDEFVETGFSRHIAELIAKELQDIDPHIIETRTKVKCEKCGKLNILRLIEYKDIGICIFVCRECYDKITNRAERISKRIKKRILRPRGGKKQWIERKE